MTSPERKLTDEQVAAWASDRGRDVAVAQLAREVIESRRLAPLHAAAVALGDDVESSIVREPGSVHHMHGDAAFLSAGISWSSVTAYRAARRALEPQPDEALDLAKARSALARIIDDECINPEKVAAIEALIDAKLAALGRAGK